MSTVMGFKDAQEMLEGLRAARMEAINFRGDAQSPGEMGSLARVCWFHGPELAKRMGVPINADEGHPPQVSSTDAGVARLLVSEMTNARSLVIGGWLDGHISKTTEAMFARGADNAFEPLIQRFSQERGFTREDDLVKEAGRPVDRAFDAGRVAAVQAAFGRTLQR